MSKIQGTKISKSEMKKFSEKNLKRYSNSDIKALVKEAAMLPLKEIKQTLLDKHYLRKHGKDAYYGQS